MNLRTQLKRALPSDYRQGQDVAKYLEQFRIVVADFMKRTQDDMVKVSYPEVADYDNLPTSGQETGDKYWIISESNVARWNGTAWDYMKAPLP